MAGIIDNIMFHLPYAARCAFASLYGYRNRLQRYGKNFKKQLREFESHLTMTSEEMSSLQEEKFRHLLLQCLDHSPYYARIFHSLGMNGDMIRSSTDPIKDFLPELPFLTKKTLRENITELHHTSLNTVCKGYTSGTTGTPLAVEWDKKSLEANFVLLNRYYRMIGLPSRFKTARFSGRIIVHPQTKKPPFWVLNFPERQLFMSTYHMSNVNLPYYVSKLNAFRPHLLEGYPSALHILARYMLDRDVRLDYTPTAVSTTAETLGEQQAEDIKQAFRCSLYDQYASSEGSPFISQCRYGHYHVHTDTGIIETLDKTKIDTDLYKAEMVVTSFRNLKTPLIRYRIGDSVLVKEEEILCSCGLPFPIVFGIFGRNDDILFTRERGYVGRLGTSFKGLHGIVCAKIVQTDMDHVVLYLVPGKSYHDEIGEQLLHNLHDRLGSDIEIVLNLVDQLPMNKNGKIKTVERLFEIKP